MCHLVGQFDAPTKKNLKKKENFIYFINFLQRRAMGHQTPSTWGVGSQVSTQLQQVIYGCIKMFHH